MVWKRFFVLALVSAFAAVLLLPALALAVSAPTYSGYSIATYRDPSYGEPPNGTATTDGCYFILTLDFDDPVVVSDAAALDASLTWDGSGGVQGLTAARTYEVDGSDATKLDITVPVTFLPGGVLKVTATEGDGLLNGITVGGAEVAWTQIHTVVPTGLKIKTTAVTVGSATSPASTTIQVEKSAVLRSMNHIIWFSNGSAILPLAEGALGTGQTTAAHHHTFWNFTTTTSAGAIVSAGASSLAAVGYTLTSDADTVTITANTPKRGEVLDVANYDDDFLQANELALADAATGLAWPSVAAGITVPMTKYTGSELTPTMTFGSGGAQQVFNATTDPAVTYANNVVANNTADLIDDLATATLVLDDCTYSVPFVIYNTTSSSVAVNVTTYGFTRAIPDQTWTGGEIEPDVNAYSYSYSVPLVEGRDYVILYANNTAVAAKDAVLAPSVTIVGIGDYYGSATAAFSIVPKSIWDTFIDYPYVAQYTGARVRPVTIVDPDTGATLVPEVDYVITYSNNIKVGKATFIVEGIGNYADDLNGGFRIANLAGKTAITKVTAGKKQATVKWSKCSGDVAGYQVSYNTKASGTFKSAGTTKALSKTVKGLKSGKVYYFKVRAYTTVAGDIYYGGWSKVLKVKVK